MKKGTTKKPAAKKAKLSKKLEVLQRDINQQLAAKAAKAKAKKKVAAKKKSY
jgi:hypothetical protein